MGTIRKAVNIDLNALESVMEEVGPFTINDQSWKGAAAFVHADERNDEHYSGVLIYIPGVEMNDVFNAELAAAEAKYYAQLTDDERSEEGDAD